MARVYTTLHGTAIARRDGGHYVIMATTSNAEPGDRVTLTAWNDEGGAAGRSWRVGTVSEGGEGRMMEGEYTSLRDIAWSAIYVAYGNVQRRQKRAALAESGSCGGRSR